jgi:hypothetical protein
MNLIKLTIPSLILYMIVACICVGLPTTNLSVIENLSVKSSCTNLGYSYQDGRCIFSDGSSCDALAFHNGLCGPNSTLTTKDTPEPVTLSRSITSNVPPTIESLIPDLPSPQKVGTIISWTAKANDPENDPIYYKFLLKGPRSGDKWEVAQDWSTSNKWAWNVEEKDIGSSDLSVQIRDGKHASPSDMDDFRTSSDYEILPRIKDNASIGSSSTDLAPLEEWNRTFGDQNTNIGVYAQQTKDNGYIVVGTTVPAGMNIYNIYLLKTDKDGNKIWDRSFGVDESFGHWVQQTSDGGYILVGHANDKSYLIKTDPDGNKIWDRLWPNSTSSESFSVQQTSDTGYIISGNRQSPNDYAYILKIDSNGNQQWSKTYGEEEWTKSKPDSVGHAFNRSFFYKGRQASQTSDGGYIIVGPATFSGSKDIWLIKTNSYGDKVWDRLFSGLGFDVGDSVQQTKDGGYIILSSRYYDDADKEAIWLIKTDENGNKLWNRTFVGSNGIESKYIEGDSVLQTDDGGYIVIGNKGRNIWMIKTDQNGNMVWDKLWQATGFSSSIQQTTDEGYVIAGTKDSFAGNSDIWLIKLKKAGDLIAKNS